MNSECWFGESQPPRPGDYDTVVLDDGDGAVDAILGVAVDAHFHGGGDAVAAMDGDGRPFAGVNCGWASGAQFDSMAN